jgi:hypothetical protein
MMSLTTCRQVPQSDVKHELIRLALIHLVPQVLHCLDSRDTDRTRTICCVPTHQFMQSYLSATSAGDCWDVWIVHWAGRCSWVVLAVKCTTLLTLSNATHLVQFVIHKAHEQQHIFAELDYVCAHLRYKVHLYSCTSTKERTSYV